MDDLQQNTLDDNLNIIRSTNWDILTYFRSVYVSQSEQIQELKSELFELDIKIEELKKTKDIYTFQSDSRRNIFSPNPSSMISRTKGEIIQEQLDELQEVRTSLSERIQTLDHNLTEIRNHIRKLEEANECLSDLYQNLPQMETPVPEEEPTSQEAQSEEEAPSEETPSEEKAEDMALHTCRLLMLQQYDNAQTAERIRSSIRQGIENSQNKLDVLKWLIQSDPTRARLTLQEIQDANQRLLQTADTIISDLEKSQEQQHPIWKAIEDCIQQYRSLYPNCMIDASIDCADYDLKIMPIITLTLLQLLREIMNNIFYYSNANKVLVKVYINSRMIDVYINDNGVGIDENYLATSPWHSGLHRLHEVITLLGGKVQVDGDIISGTNVRFSFPICLEQE